MSYIFTNPATIPSRVIKPTILTQAILYATQMSIRLEKFRKRYSNIIPKKKHKGKKNQCRGNGPISQYSNLLSWLLHDTTTAIGINTNFICTVSN